MPVLPLLYSFRRCPYALRARLALKAAGLRVVLREVALRDKPAELLAANPQGTVPVLVLPSGEVLAQSLDIMHWALARQDPLAWRPAPGSAAAGLTERWIEANDTVFKRLLDGYKYPGRHPGPQGVAARDQALAEHLRPLEAVCQAHGGPQLLGPRAGLLDAALMPFVRQFAQVDAAWWAQAPLPGLRQWLAGWLDSPQFAEVMQPGPPWRAGDAERIF